MQLVSVHLGTADITVGSWVCGEGWDLKITGSSGSGMACLQESFLLTANEAVMDVLGRGCSPGDYVLENGTFSCETCHSALHPISAGLARASKSQCSKL